MAEAGLEKTKMSSIKQLVESKTLTNDVPSTYTFTSDPFHHHTLPQPEDTLPVIDYSLLVSDAPEQRAKVVRDLGKACEEWGFFLVVNHGVSESTMKAAIDASNEFFHLEEEEKQNYCVKDMWDPVQYGTSISTLEKIFFWRDFVKVFISPEFHPPTKPAGFSNSVLEYSRKVREIARDLLGGVSESLGLERTYIDKAMDLENGFLFFAANFYPPCPRPELAMGIPAHTDHGLLTLLIHNGITGLQILHDDKWINIDSISNAIVVNVGDNLEVLSNGKYKSVQHRATVNGKETRISIAMPHGPSLESIVKPIQEVLEKEGRAPIYKSMKFKEFLELKQTSRIGSGHTLDRLRI